MIPFLLLAGLGWWWLRSNGYTIALQKTETGACACATQPPPAPPVPSIWPRAIHSAPRFIDERIDP